MESDTIMTGEMARTAIQRLNIGARDLADGAGIPISTAYKVVRGGTLLREDTLVEVTRFIRARQAASPEARLIPSCVGSAPVPPTGPAPAASTTVELTIERDEQ